MMLCYVNLYTMQAQRCRCPGFDLKLLPNHDSVIMLKRPKIDFYDSIFNLTNLNYQDNKYVCWWLLKYQSIHFVLR